MLGTILQISNTTLENSRRIAHDLLPPVLQKFGLQAALEELKNDYNRATPNLMHFACTYKGGTLDAKKELHIFRIVQELVNNSLKHGKATHIRLALTTDPTGLEYQDNGLGFAQTEGQGKPGLGMKNIESRVALLNAESEFTSEAGNGIRFSLTNIKNYV